MANPYIGEIRMGGWNFAPQGWAFCDGSLLNISDNLALFALLGAMYGGNGTTTFALPDLRGRLSLHSGSGFAQAQSGGAETVTLTTAQIPAHTHPVLGTQSVASANSPGGNVLAQPSSGAIYSGPGSPRAMANAVQPAGGSQPHDNMHPYQCVTFIIALVGIFPPRN